ncbi:MAG: hypothetical protein LBQ83_05935 [Candidatus Margulisbacteria bacterium]|nr:hypothetical protein [Candidatus Margulisiibacteriota bacterium]
MDVKKLVITTAILAAVGSATVLDGVSGLGLGTNPAFPAIWKSEKRVDAGFNLLGKTKSDDKVLKDDDSVTVKDLETSLSGFWASYTDSFQDYWYSVSYSNASGALGGTKTTSYTGSDKNTKTSTGLSTEEDTGYGISFALARDFAEFGGFTGGVQLGVNVDGKKTVSQTKPINGKTQELISKTASDPYLTVALGLVKDIDASSKVLFGQTLGTRKNVKTLDQEANKAYKDALGSFDQKDLEDLGYDTEYSPAETAIGYVYKINDALELGATYTRNWGAKFNNQRYEDLTVESLGYNSLGLAADYLWSEFQFQGFANFTAGAELAKVDGEDIDGDRAKKGTDTTQFGLNAIWTPSFASIGSVGIGIVNDRAVNWADGTVSDSTSTALFYTYLF